MRIDRLQRKVDQKNRRIAGMERRIARLEHSLSIRSDGAIVVDSFSLRKDITKAVQEALCNVRMIPVFGSLRDKQFSVKLTAEERESTVTPPDSR